MGTLSTWGDGTLGEGSYVPFQGQLVPRQGAAEPHWRTQAKDAKVAHSAPQASSPVWQVKTDFAVGTLHEGVVSRVARYGVFVDFEGADGLLHISQISHARIPDIYKVFSPGDHVKCVVAAVDAGTGRLSLCTKRLEPTPGDMLTQPELVYRLAEETVSQRTPGPVVGEVSSPISHHHTMHPSAPHT